MRRKWKKEKTRMHKYTETTNDSNYDGSRTSRHFRFGTCTVSGRVILCTSSQQKTRLYTASAPASDRVLAYRFNTLRGQKLLWHLQMEIPFVGLLYT